MKTKIFSILLAIVASAGTLWAQSMIEVHQDCSNIIHEEQVRSLILSATEVTMSPGDDAKKITVKTNTGTVVTYEWSTDDADNAVITLSAKGSSAIITPVGVGVATITVNVKGNENLTAECVVTVVDKLQSLKFTRLSCNWGTPGVEGYNPPENIDSTRVYMYSTFKDGNTVTGQADTLFCYLGDIRFRLLADGETWISNDGWLTGKSNNGAYTIEAVGRIPVLANCINQRFFQHAHDYDNGFSQAAKDEWIKPTYYELGTIAGKYGMTWGRSIKDGQIPDTIPYSLYAGSLENEARYVELMTKAYVEDYPSNPQSYEDFETFYQTRDLAIAEIKGAVLQKWIYNELSGHWQPSAFVAGIVPTLDFEIINNTNVDEVGYMHTNVISAANIVIRPFGGLDSCGVDLNYNKLTKKYEANSNQFQWGKTIDCSFVVTNSSKSSRYKKVSQEEQVEIFTLTLRAEDCEEVSSVECYASQEVKIMAIPMENYIFTHWSDGNTDNPRTIELTQDITLEAIFDYQLTGKCGKDNALTWKFNPSSMALDVTGKGSLSENYTYGSFIESLTIGNEVTVIGQNAFKNRGNLKHVVIGSSVKVLEQGAFYNCSGIQTITCYSQRPPTVNADALYGLDYSTIVYVPKDYLDNYVMHDIWGLYDVRPLEAETVQTNDINITPSENTADVVWPQTANAATYELVIKDKNGNVICTLVFNANGQLTQIAFAAPSRINAPAQAQAAGFAFTVTGLESGTTYDLTLTAKNGSGATLNSRTVSFSTQGPTALEDIADDAASASVRKVLQNGQLYILRDGKAYTATGAEVK